MKLYALHDKKAKSFSSFHVERSDAVATRSFADAVGQENSVFFKYPDDFELVALCDVSQDYGNDLPADMQYFVEPFNMQVIVTARQCVDMMVPRDKQLSLLNKEA